MSDTASDATPPPNPQPAASSGWFNLVITGIEHGAATVYHRVLDAEQAVLKWEHDNPAIADLVTEGVAFTKGFLVRYGVPVDAVIVIEQDIVAALKYLAAADPTVKSGS